MPHPFNLRALRQQIRPATKSISLLLCVKSTLVYTCSWICIKRRDWIWMCLPIEIKILVIAQNFSLKIFWYDLCDTLTKIMNTPRTLSPRKCYKFEAKWKSGDIYRLHLILFWGKCTALTLKADSSLFISKYTSEDHLRPEKQTRCLWQPFTEFKEAIPLLTLDSL